jgi:hypothetical protein
LIGANVRYWSSVAPLARRGLASWERQALAIPDDRLRSLAVGKLRAERFNPLLAATLATLAPREQRRRATEAIVALQIAYDFLDALTEQPFMVADEESCTVTSAEEPCTATGAGGVAAATRVYRALADALAPEHGVSGGPYLLDVDDGGYLRALVQAVRRPLAALPSADAVYPVAILAAERCAQAQILGHEAVEVGGERLERWARGAARGSGLQWPELLAGAQASVLCLHALIAAAADPTTTDEQAQALDALYLRVGALTMLDSLIDREQDLAHDEPGYLDRYRDGEHMGRRLAMVATDVARQAQVFPRHDHHMATLVGVVAFYGSAPAAAGPTALPVFAAVYGEVGDALMRPTLALMRMWRAIERSKRRSPSVGGGV